MSQSTIKKTRRQIQKILKHDDKEMETFIEDLKIQWVNEIKLYPKKDRKIIAREIRKGIKKPFRLFKKK